MYRLLETVVNTLLLLSENHILGRCVKLQSEYVKKDDRHYIE